jgi:hypothetical protein
MKLRVLNSSDNSIWKMTKSLKTQKIMIDIQPLKDKGEIAYSNKKRPTYSQRACPRSASLH